MTNKTKLDWKKVRWQCESASLDFKSTKEIEPKNDIIGQPQAIEALEYAIQCRAFGQNAFVKGLYGTSRLEMIGEFLHNNPKSNLEVFEHCYVANFQQPDRPRLIVLKAGEAKYFKRWMKKFADFITKELNANLDAEDVVLEKSKIEKNAQEQIVAISKPFEEKLYKKGLALLNLKGEKGVQTIIAPMVEDKPQTPSQWQEMIAEGKVPQEKQVSTQQDLQVFNVEFQEVMKKINHIKYTLTDKLQEIIENKARQILQAQNAAILKRFHGKDVHAYLDEVAQDVIDQYFYSGKEEFSPHKRYSVNVLNTVNKEAKSPVVIERVPSLSKLLGTIESKWGEKGPELSDHMSITSGTLLRANGGFLIVDARDLLSEQGAWKILTRTLKNQLLEIVPAEMSWPFSQPTIKPEAIALDVRVIILGDAQTYYLLDNNDPDFPDLFKVLVDFDTEIERNKASFKSYSAVISRLVAQENLLHFDNTAVAALIEHGARICARKDRLTTNFPRIADLAREGNFLAHKLNAQQVTAQHINDAIKRTKSRAGLASKKFQQMLANGTINVFTDGGQVGEINGMAVIHAGPVVYGFPSRISATVAPGRAGVINIEGRADMSGSIHTKGFAILGGLLRHILPTNHPLTFSGSIAFEQSYGGIDGDSASGAEFCCLISALTQIPISQEYAMTGAIDQHGRVQAIGGVNEKIEGFFDTCQAQGFTGNQGVIIPQSNAGDLMLRADVQQAVKDNKFAVHAVDHVTQALEILCKQPVGTLIDGSYTKGSILHNAMQKVQLFWQNTNGVKKS